MFWVVFIHLKLNLIKCTSIIAFIDLQLSKLTSVYFLFPQKETLTVANVVSFLIFQERKLGKCLDALISPSLIMVYARITKYETDIIFIPPTKYLTPSPMNSNN